MGEVGRGVGGGRGGERGGAAQHPATGAARRTNGGPARAGYGPGVRWAQKRAEARTCGSSCAAARRNDGDGSVGRWGGCARRPQHKRRRVGLRRILCAWVISDW